MWGRFLPRGCATKTSLIAKAILPRGVSVWFTYPSVDWQNRELKTPPYPHPPIYVGTGLCCVNTIPQPFSATHFSTLQLLQKFYKNWCQSLDKANKKKPPDSHQGAERRSIYPTEEKQLATAVAVGQRPIRNLPHHLEIVYTPRIAGTRDLCANVRSPY